MKLKKDQIKIKEYRELTEELFKLRENEDYSDEALLKNNEILIINPEFYTMWNYRREILSRYKSEDLKIYENLLNQDLKFVLSQLKKIS